MVYKRFEALNNYLNFFLADPQLVRCAAISMLQFIEHAEDVDYFPTLFFREFLIVNVLCQPSVLQGVTAFHCFTYFPKVFCFVGVELFKNAVLVRQDPSLDTTQSHCGFLQVRERNWRPSCSTVSKGPMPQLLFLFFGAEPQKGRAAAPAVDCMTRQNNGPYVRCFAANDAIAVFIPIEHPACQTRIRGFR
jgi:hypothetical protein